MFSFLYEKSIAFMQAMPKNIKAIAIKYENIALPVFTYLKTHDTVASRFKAYP